MFSTVPKLTFDGCLALKGARSSAITVKERDDELGLFLKLKRSGHENERNGGPLGQMRLMLH